MTGSNIQLYRLSSPHYRLPFFVDGNGHVVTSLGNNIPMFRWPDGHWCHSANTYMRELFERGLSRRNRGGTLATYAAHISHLIRYCYQRGIEPYQLTDDGFTAFIQSLSPPDRRKSLQPRSPTSVLSIGRTCVEYLMSVGRELDDPMFVGKNGRIRVSEKEYVVRGTRGTQRRKYWHHHSFPAPSPLARRLPISSDLIERLQGAVLGLSGRSTYLRKRRYVMLRLLEITGGRRAEVAGVRCSAVLRAATMPEPMLEVETLKKREDETRLVPISRSDLFFLIEFIQKNRRQVVRSTCGLSRDDDILLISETTGFGLRPNTLTQEVSALANYAGVSEKTCAHMFRHRFITKLFISLAEQLRSATSDSFRRSLRDDESIKKKVLEWTGQKSIASLDVYIDIAFAEYARFTKAYDLVRATQIIDSFRSSLSEFRTDLRQGHAAKVIAQQLDELVGALSEDLCHLMRSQEPTG